MSASNVVNLDEIVGTDIEFIFRGETYVFPGDPSTESVFGFIDLYSDLLEAQQAAAEAAAKDGTNAQALAGKRDEIKKLLDKARDGLLAMFQERDPDMKVLPFGHRSTMAVLQYALRQLGVTVPDAPEDPPAPAPKRKAPARASSVKKQPSKATSSQRKR
jgi:hypothetical protein